MAINQISTANTFQEWLTTTSLLVAVANNLTDNTSGGFLACSSIYIQGAGSSLNVRNHANINTLQANTANISNISLEHGSITGNGTLTIKDANIWSNIVSANVTGNLAVGGEVLVYNRVTAPIANIATANIANISFANGHVVANGNLTISNINVTSNIVSLNVTQGLSVGGDTVISGNLTITGNTTLDAVGFNDLAVAGQANVGTVLNVGTNATIGGNIAAVNSSSYVHTPTANAGSLNVTGNTTLQSNTIAKDLYLTGTFTGPANDSIYSAIAGANSNFGQAIETSLAFAIALG